MPPVTSGLSPPGSPASAPGEILPARASTATRDSPTATPANIVVGNSVQSLGFFGGISSGFKTLSGGEITNLTQLITEGRHAAIGRMEREASDKGAHGVTGVTSDLKTLSGMQEFIAVGSA